MEFASQRMRRSSFPMYNGLKEKQTDLIMLFLLKSTKSKIQRKSWKKFGKTNKP